MHIETAKNFLHTLELSVYYLIIYENYNREK